MPSVLFRLNTIGQFLTFIFYYFYIFLIANSELVYWHAGITTALPVKSDSDNMFCLQSYQGLQ